MFPPFYSIGSCFLWKSEEGLPCVEEGEILEFDELVRLAGIATGPGIRN